MVTRIAVVSLLLVAGVGAHASAQNTTTRVSVSTSDVEANGSSSTAAISADGRYVAFISQASNLVVGDTNGMLDVFVRDRQTGQTERVSVTHLGSQITGHSTQPSISADGRFVAFVSDGTNVVSGDTNDKSDVFVRDRVQGMVTRVSVSSGGFQVMGDSTGPVISQDGRYVVFTSQAANVVQADTNGEQDVFRHDRETRVTTRVSVGALLSNGFSVQANGPSVATGLSADGQVVVFASPATNLVANDTNATTDAFVHDLATRTTTRVSLGPGGEQGNKQAFASTISHDGRFVVFDSLATNFDQAGAFGIYVHDRQRGATSALSVDPNPNRAPFFVRISGDGRYVCFMQLDATETLFETLAMDRVTLTKMRINVASNGDVGNGSGGGPCALSADATVIAFDSMSTNLVAGDTNDKIDVFVRTMFATVAVDKASLNFAAITSGGTFLSQTGTQTLRLTQSGVGTVTWTAASNVPWLQVSPAAGSGSGAISVSVMPAAGVPTTGTVTGTIFVSLTGSANSLPGIPVSLTLKPGATNAIPFGTVDTPTDNRTGVTGAVPFTGWALDDIEVMRVSICRAAFGAEVAPFDPNCGGAAEIFVGFAVFIDGARPDVLGAFSSYPLATRAGWGFMVLTNFLPNQGNGTYRFTMRAQDREGSWFVLGVRTMTCANASATLPFGTLDTPLQGGTAAGSSYINFGWALTPQPKTIPIDGSTIRVLIDGVDAGTADYNHARPDIQALFPGFKNTNGAVGFRIFDTTLMSNGLHTISWVVTDDAGATEGIGSRFFTVSNGVGAMTASASVSSIARIDIDSLPIDTTPLAGRRGWDLDAPHESFTATASGVSVIRSEEVNRVELQLGAGDYAGYLRTPAGLAPLPVGSRLESATSTFTWAPGVGFVGPYNFVFVQSAHGRAVSRREVRIVLQPKGRGAVGPQVVIDTPRAHAAVDQPFLIGGWAVDLDAPEGTGVTTLHAWAFPAFGGAPIFLGAAAYGGARPDVAAVHGDRFKDSGFGLIAQGLPAGDYDLAVFAWSTETMGFVAPKVVRVTVTIGR